MKFVYTAFLAMNSLSLVLRIPPTFQVQGGYPYMEIYFLFSGGQMTVRMPFSCQLSLK